MLIAAIATTTAVGIDPVRLLINTQNVVYFDFVIAMFWGISKNFIAGISQTIKLMAYCFQGAGLLVIFEQVRSIATCAKSQKLIILNWFYFSVLPIYRPKKKNLSFRVQIRKCSHSYKIRY